MKVATHAWPKKNLTLESLLRTKMLSIGYNKYSRVPNTSRVWNNGIGWKIHLKSIVVGGGKKHNGWKSYPKLTIIRVEMYA